MRIKISRPTEEGISFAKEYLEEERDELPYYGFSLEPGVISILSLTRRGVYPSFLSDLRNGKLDNNEYDIDLFPFKWTNYLIIKRYLDKVNEATREANPITQLSRELGLKHGSYKNVFKTHPSSSYFPSFVPNKKTKTKHGGKKRRIRARRTHRRRS